MKETGLNEESGCALPPAIVLSRERPDEEIGSTKNLPYNASKVAVYARAAHNLGVDGAARVARVFADPTAPLRLMAK